MTHNLWQLQLLQLTDTHTKNHTFFSLLSFALVSEAAVLGVGPLQTQWGNQKRVTGTTRRQYIIKKDNTEESKLPPHVGGEAVPDTQRK